MKVEILKQEQDLFMLFWLMVQTSFYEETNIDSLIFDGRIDHEDCNRNKSGKVISFE